MKEYYFDNNPNLTACIPLPCTAPCTLHSRLPDVLTLTEDEQSPGPRARPGGCDTTERITRPEHTPTRTHARREHIARVKGDLCLCIISDYAEAHELSQPDLELSRTELPRSGFAGIKPHSTFQCAVSNITQTSCISSPWQLSQASLNFTSRLET